MIGTNVTAAKGLQYPFPSHPPVLHPQPPSTPTTPTSTTPSTASTTSTITRGANHGDTRLKPCTSVSSDNRTSSKVNVNRSGVVIKTSEKNSSVNIPSDVGVTSTTTTQTSAIKTVKCDKPSDKIACRRDSSSNSSSPRGGDVKTRRNSDARKEDSDSDKQEQEKKEKARLENERLEKERLEKEKQEKERLEKEKLERERLERESELEKERLEKEKREKERKEKEERERREREEQERLEREKKEQEEREKREEEERLEKERQEKLEKERERKREEERKHKEDNHEKKKDDHRHSDSKHRDNNHTKEHEFKKDSHESRSSHEKNRHHIERDAERRKESVKENRDNNVHEKQKNFNDTKVESRHMSIDFERNKTYENITKLDPSKRKERNNSLPANIGLKRRLSAHESEHSDEAKKIKLSQDHKKLSERRDSKDSTRSEEKTKSKHKNNTKIYDEKTKHNNTKECDEKRKDREDRHKSNKQKLEKHKTKSKSREKECRESPTTPKSPGKELSDKDFLARLDLRSNEEVEKQKQRKEKKKVDEEKDETKKSEIKKDKHLEKSKSREESRVDDKKCQKKDRTRKLTQNSSDNNSDSDEPKKHSIFDIVDDEPAYISMYDKVKARSCKNMQKQEEEKRQEKIKAKFSQLKQSRAKREEKKRSTSWDEDSDSDRERSDKIDHKTKRGSKMLIMSSDEEEPRKSHKKREIYSDSDSERVRQIKSEHNETSEDDRVKNKLQRKGSKSRITSDTSDDDIKKPIKSEIFSDNEIDQGFADSEDKPFKVKDELNRIIKKARDKHQESIVDQMNAQIFGDSSSPVLDIKSERFNNRHSFVENSSGDENNEKKERSEIRKKHKKKQKRQKHSLSSEECNKLESVVDGILTECTEKVKHHDKKKQHSKKDKKRDKSKDDRDKTKKSKKNKSDIKSDLKRDGKMENIFGSLSEDSESGVKDSEEHKPNLFLERFNDSNVQSSVYASDSDREVEKEKERESKEEHRKRKEKKRREKERRLQEEAAASEQINENSMDYADMGKQLEANIKDDSMEEIEKNEIEANHDTTDDSFRFNETGEFHEKKEERKEPREKKKKRKKSKEEKQKHHHHHHHDKNKVKVEVKKEEIKLEEIKVETEESKSLPNLTDSTPSPPQNKSSSSLDFSISPVPREALISPIPKTPTTSKEKKRDKFIPGFGGTEIDEKLHENAVKSISEFDPPKEPPKPVEEPKPEPTPEPTEEKPRVVISQEETEDAVAALLGESFGSGQFDECYNEEEINSTNDQSSTIPDDNLAQDDEEMRQAVQSLSANDLDVKPETPQSEHELQIDTDTEEQEETSVRFDQPPKTPEITEPKTPDYYRNEPKAPIGSPPSLTPIKPNTEIKQEPKSTSLSLPMLPEQPRSVISQTWIEKKEPKTEPQVSQPQPLRTYGSQVKIPEPAYPPLAALTKQEHPQITTSSEQVKLQTYPVLHNLPKTSTPDSPKVATTTNLSLSRLPITPIMVSKPLQATTVLLPQAKIAHTLEPPVLVSASDPRPQERPRMVFHTTSNVTPHFSNIVQSQPRMVRSLPPQTLLMPARQLPSTSYLSNIPQSSYNTVVTSPATTCQNSVVKPTIIMSTNQIPTTTIPTTKPFMPVIKETPPKLVTIPEIRVSQPAVIQQTKEIKEDKPEPEILKVTPDTRTSTPSPVIVQTPKEPEKKPQPEIEESPQQLAIEKVTEELNLTLKKEVDVKEDQQQPEIKKEEEEVKIEASEEKKPEIKEEKVEVKPKPEPVKEEEEKADTESTTSDISKERSSAEILTSKDDPLDNKEDSDYWSAKEVNIDSVIKTLCSADELSDHSSEPGKDEWEESKGDEKSDDSSKKEEICDESDDITETDDKDISGRGARRGGRTRGRKTRGGAQARRGGKVVKEVVTAAKRGGRGGCRQRGERKSSKSESDITSDVYEFRDDSDENKERPRLILTIKSPAAVNTQAVVKEVVKEPSPKPETKEEFLSPVANTRKSRRLQEKDVLRNTVDDTIEDVVRNTVVTRSNQNARRSTRQAVINKPSPETPRKSPRGGRKKDRRASDPSEDSSEEKSKTDSETKSESDLTEIEKPKEEKEEIKEKPHEGLKVKMLRRVKGDMIQEPTNLIDPVTGLLTPMRECEEGRYIPLPNKTNENQHQQSVIAPPQQPKCKPQSLKAHVLSSQAAKAVVSQQIPQQPQPQPIQVKKTNIIVNQPVTIQPTIAKPSTPLSQALNVNVSMATYTTSHLSPRHTVPVNVLSKALTKPQLSPNQMAALAQKQILNPILSTQSQIMNLKQQPIKQPVINKTKPTHNIHQQQILTGSVASPPLNKGPMPGIGASQNRIVQPPHPKGVMEPPKIDVPLSNVILGPRSNLSPQGQLRHVPVPAYEASLVSLVF